MRYIFICLLVLLNTGCGTMSMSERLEAGADAGNWSLCNYPYPYVKNSIPGSKCDKLWDKFNNVNKQVDSQ